MVVGLGNPGRNYAQTRHNIGFVWLDEWSRQLSMSFSSQPRFDSDIMACEGLVFMKPQTFMNLSGTAVCKLAKFKRIAPEQILVIHDELDLPFSTLRIKFGGGSAGHNGIKNIINEIGAKFWRLRVGIGRPIIKNQTVTDFVLGRFSHQESTEICQTAQHFFDNYWNIIQNGQLEQAISSLHKNCKSPATD
ncbi:Peptidyl-tRNA hydrolase [Candidatus Ichthyocystis hellenicum]|uniref:Peptidyl-tRNA hydrolase n=2 Tax=Burkholderiales genera incertae sedis TaxID=224471 RepID=A0A0S4M0C9_9BURK|nr:Peptidyl-tRNA hydrolase [Candidatus Ichthyocystis hellenicum]